MSDTIHPTRSERMLRLSLRQLRFALAKYEGLPPYRIFNNQSLDQLAKLHPTDLQGLRCVPGMGDYRCNRYGGTILLCIERTLSSNAAHWAETARKRAQQPAQQTVKALFESGFEPYEIAQSRQVQEGSVLRSMEYLQNAGEISISNWVEEQIPKQELERGTQFFEGQPQQNLRAAYEALGLDYDTLRMCRMYVSQVERLEF
ncbi:MAG: HRDC domain-containing protein [Bacteroidia bacterium]